MSKSLPDVFLCHNSQDKPIVRRLGELLHTNGIKSWIDEVSLDAGSQWTRKLADALLTAPAVVVCLGPSGLGRYQGHEVDIITQRRIEAGQHVIAVILPTCAERPDIPIWLSNSQQIDLRNDETDMDPFGRLLHGIDKRNPAGHHRPTMIVLLDRREATSGAAADSLMVACHSLMHRIRVFDYSDLLLPQRLSMAFREADVFVSLLSDESFRDQPEPFEGGVASGAHRMAADAGLEVVQWRHSEMALPNAPELYKLFCSPEIRTLMPVELARHATSRTEHRHARRRSVAAVLTSVKDEADTDSASSNRSLMGYPLNDAGKRFVRQVTMHMNEREIDCDSPPKWELVLDQLKEEPESYDAIVIVLTGDDDWLCACTAALRALQKTHGDRLPPVRAYLHKAEEKEDADPIPIRLKQFEEYYGVKDLPRLEERILAAGGHRS